MVSEKELEESAKLAKQSQCVNVGRPVDGLTATEEQLLAFQKYTALTIIVCCLASMTQGWDQVANGNAGWTDDLGILVDRCDPRQNDGTLRFAIAQAVPWFSASVLGPLLSDPFSEYFGRRMALFTAALCSFTSSVWGSHVTSWEALVGSRILLGLGIAGKASVVPILISEILPSVKRDFILVNWQIFNAVGVIVGSIACYILRDSWTRNSWRLQILSGAIPGCALLMATFVSCESPRWLIIQGKHRRAFTTLLNLRQERRIALKELVSIHYQIQGERALFLRRDAGWELDPANDPFHTNMERNSWWDRFRCRIYVPRVRRAAIASMILMISQQLNGYVYHASRFLQ